MAHSHHHHHEAPVIDHLNKAFIFSIVLNAAFVLIEALTGIFTNSLALLSDAGHNLSDVFSLLLSLIAFKLLKVRSTATFTYGYRKSTVLVSLLNACILLVTVGIILVESIRKLMHPEPTNGDTIAIVAGIGVLINAFTAWLFFRDKEKDLNVKGAYLHLAADALVSVGVVVSGIVIRYTGWYLIDPLIGIGIAIVIFVSTWELLSHSIRLSLDGVPPGMNVKEIEEGLMASEPEVKGVHHVHVWAISTTQTAFTGHILVDCRANLADVKKKVKKYLDVCGITHATLEFETEEEQCPENPEPKHPEHG